MKRASPTTTPPAMSSAAVSATARRVSTIRYGTRRCLRSATAPRTGAVSTTNSAERAVAELTSPGPESNPPPATRSSTQSGKKKERMVTEKMVFEKS